MTVLFNIKNEKNQVGAFLHIPKTGGIWVRNTLKQNGATTLEIKSINDVSYTTEGSKNTQHNVPWFHPSFMDAKYVLAFVRDPIEWYRSYWAFKQTWRWTNKKEFDQKTAHSIFPSFIDRVIKEYPNGYLTRVYQFYTDSCTHVGKQEHLAEYLSQFMKDRGYIIFNVHSPKSNVADKGVKSKALYRKDQIGKILEIEKGIVKKYYDNKESDYFSCGIVYDDFKS